MGAECASAAGLAGRTCVRGSDGETAGNDGRGGLDLLLDAHQRMPKASEHSEHGPEGLAAVCGQSSAVLGLLGASDIEVRAVGLGHVGGTE